MCFGGVVGQPNDHPARCHVSMQLWQQGHTHPLASGCQYGAKRPEKAGTKYTSPVSFTLLARCSVCVCVCVCMCVCWYEVEGRGEECMVCDVCVEEVKEEVKEEVRKDYIGKPISLASLKNSRLSLSHLTL